MKRKLFKTFVILVGVFIVLLFACYVFYQYQITRLLKHTKTSISGIGDVIGTMNLTYITSYNTVNVPDVGKIHAKEAIVLAKIGELTSNAMLQSVPIRIFLGGETDSQKPVYLTITPRGYINTNVRFPSQSPADLNAGLRKMKVFRAGILLERKSNPNMQCSLCLVNNFFLVQNKHILWIPLFPAVSYLETE